MNRCKVLLILMTFLGGTAPQWAAAAQHPDILFIMIDDLNDWVGPLGGHSQVRTPNIDRLAAQGITFTNAYATAASCNPSRTSLMSGLRPSTTGIYGNMPDWRIVDEVKGVTMMPAHFRSHGYHTSGGGKIFHAHSFYDHGMSGFNDPGSWDEFYPSKQRQLPDEILPVERPQNHNPGGFPFIGFDWYGLMTEDYAMADGRVTDWAVRELSTRQDRPVFTAVGIYRPHLPWYVPRKYMDMYPLETVQIPEVPEDDLDDVPEVVHEAEMGGRITHEWVVKEHKWQEAVRGYLASISFADAMVGKVLDALENSGRADNTIIVLLSDHGWQLGHKLRWRKMSLWRQANRVPLIIVAPGVTTPGSKSNKPVSLLDLYPTLMDLAGLPPPAHTLEGTSLAPLLKNPRARWDHVAISTWGYMNHAVQDEEFRYIRYQDGAEELYDHYKDPNEWTNLAGNRKYARVKQRLGKYLPQKNVVGLCPERAGEPPSRPECDPRK
jgi:arylsulfatase A-like enzyme